MTLKDLVSVGLLVFMLSLSVAASAEEDYDDEGSPYSRSGVYVFLGGSAGIDQAAEDELEDILGDVGVSDGLGFKTKLGYRSFPWLATELEVEYLQGIDVDFGGIDALELEYLTVTVNAKIYLPLGRFQPFGLLGVGLMNASFEDSLGLGFEDDFTGGAVRAGGGIDVYLTDHLAVTVDISYVLPTEDVEDLDYLSIGWGLQYKF